MSQDQFPYAGTHRALAGRAVLNVLVALALVLLGAAVSLPAASAKTNGAGSGPVWPAHWNAYAYADGTPIGEVDAEVLPAYVDRAGAPCAACAAPAPSVAFTSDGVDAFFRIRLATDITDTTRRGSFEGAFLVQIADADGDVKAVVGVDGGDPAHLGVYVADPSGAVVTNAHETPRRADSRLRVVEADDDGSGRFFLDFHVPLRAIAAASGGTVTAVTPIKLYSGSSTSTDLAPVDLAAINGDFMLGDVAAVDFAALSTVQLLQREHSVEFDSTGGSPVAAQLVAEGFPVPAPARPTRTGYTFEGWYTGESAYDFNAAVTGRTTLFAQWSRIGYPVTFDSTGGSAVDDQEVLFGDTVVVPTAPTRDGQAFLGWSPAAGGGEVVDLANQPVTAPTALFAHWSEDKASVRAVASTATASARSSRSIYSVVFYPNGGSAVASQTVTAGDAASVPTEPTRAGYAFQGWFANADGDAAWDFSSPIGRATTLYAHWKPSQKDGVGDPTKGTVDLVADVEQAAGATGEQVGAAGEQRGGAGEQVGTDGEQSGGADSDDGLNGGATLPDTGNQVPVTVLPGAVMMLLVGFVLMRRGRRRFAEARDSE